MESTGNWTLYCTLPHVPSFLVVQGELRKLSNLHVQEDWRPERSREGLWFTLSLRETTGQMRASLFFLLDSFFHLLTHLVDSTKPQPFPPKPEVAVYCLDEGVAESPGSSPYKLHVLLISLWCQQLAVSAWHHGAESWVWYFPSWWSPCVLRSWPSSHLVQDKEQQFWRTPNMDLKFWYMLWASYVFFWLMPLFY